VAHAFDEVAGGLRFPEGPVAMRDGSVVVTEIQGGNLSRVGPDGSVSVVAHLGGGPNGAAVGPDKKMYVCNNGGSVWHEHGGFTFPGTATADINETESYSGGRIERVDLQTGQAELLSRGNADVALRAPNDLVFDHTGGFWFTDFGKRRERTRDRTGVFYARPARDHGGYDVSEVLFPLNTPNGIGLSPDERVLYVAETETGRLWAWDVAAPGELDLDAYRPWHGRLLGMRCDGAMFDSLAVDGRGNIAVATIGNGGITVFDPDGAIVEVIDTDDPMTTNICFGGEDLRTAYITCAGTGRLLRMQWPHPGLACAFTG
jgi:gluconolactonase